MGKNTLTKILFTLLFICISDKIFGQLNIKQFWDADFYAYPETYGNANEHSKIGKYGAVDFYFGFKNRPNMYNNGDIIIRDGVQIKSPLNGKLYLHILEVTNYSDGSGENFPTLNPTDIINKISSPFPSCFSFYEGKKKRLFDMSVVVDDGQYQVILSHMMINRDFFTSAVLENLRLAINQFYLNTAQGYIQGTDQRVAIDTELRVTTEDDIGTVFNFGIAQNYHLHFQLFRTNYSDSNPFLGNPLELMDKNIFTIDNQIILDKEYEAIYNYGTFYRYPSMPRKLITSGSFIVNGTWNFKDKINICSEAGGSVIGQITNGLIGDFLDGPIFSKIYDDNTYHIWYKVDFGSINGWVASEYLDKVDISNQSEINWSRIDNMPTPRSWTQAVYYNNKIYIIGGCSSLVNTSFANEVSIIEEYDLAKNTWQQKASMNYPRIGAAAVEYNGKIYVFGGFNQFNWSANKTAEVYDIASDKWSILPSMPTGRSWMKAVVIENKIYVLGGVGFNYEDVVEIFDLSTSSWTSKKTFNEGRYLHAVTAHNNKIYLIGGDSWQSGQDKIFSDLQVYDIMTDTWQNKNSMPSQATGLEAVATNNEIWVFGANQLCRKYNIITDSWDEINSDQFSTSDYSVVFANGFFYKFGGGGWGPTTNIAEKTSMKTGADDEKIIPNVCYLSQNYPNPFNPVTTIKYSIPKSSFISIKIYDILGREITTLVNEEKTPGNYEIKFNGSNLSSGVYFYRLNAGEFSETKKLILLK